jgi:hypothetical protein
VAVNGLRNMQLINALCPVRLLEKSSSACCPMQLLGPWTAALCSTGRKRFRSSNTRPRSMQVDVRARLRGVVASLAPCASHAASAANVTVVLMASNHMEPHHTPALAEQLSKFPALKHLDVSDNPRLRLLPIGMLRIAATLETFKCDGCSLVLPPQSMFSTPEENPRRIQQLLSKRSSSTVLTLSAANLTSITAREVAALLPFYPALKQLDVSANPGLRCSGAAVILSALSGKLLVATHLSHELCPV